MSVPNAVPLGLTDEFAHNSSRQAILAWEIANSVRGKAAAAAVEPVERPAPSAPAKRWYELVRERDRVRFDSAP